MENTFLIIRLTKLYCFHNQNFRDIVETETPVNHAAFLCSMKKGRMAPDRHDIDGKPKTGFKTRDIGMENVLIQVVKRRLAEAADQCLLPLPRMKLRISALYCSDSFSP